MKRVLSVKLILILASLSSFTKRSNNHEQIIFDYFISDIIRSDFMDVTIVEFKGKAENSYSMLGEFKICLRGAESTIKSYTKHSLKSAKTIGYSHVKGITITNFWGKATAPRLYIYPSIHVADHYYVFLSFQKPDEPTIKYMFRLSTDGDVLESCRLE